MMHCDLNDCPASPNMLPIGSHPPHYAHPPRASSAPWVLPMLSCPTHASAIWIEAVDEQWEAAATLAHIAVSLRFGSGAVWQQVRD